MSHKHHISHIEIPALKNSDAANFYKKVFDWNIVHDDEMNYTMFTAEGGTGGGFSEVSDENPVGNVLLYIDTPDLKASLEAVKAHGGTVTMESYVIPTVGEMAMFKDPTGNLLCLIQMERGE
jgi:predicted enzyme related to lactoylglutathione lyase